MKLLQLLITSKSNFYLQSNCELVKFDSSFGPIYNARSKLSKEVINMPRERTLEDAVPQVNKVAGLKASKGKGGDCGDCAASCGDCSSCACGSGSCGSCSSCASCGCDCSNGLKK